MDSTPQDPPPGCLVLLLRLSADMAAEVPTARGEFPAFAVARQLADGVRTRLGVDGRPADLGVSTTGVAGPDPQGGRPVGTVFVGISSERGTRAVALQLVGDREAIRRATVVRAVSELAAELGITTV